MDPSRPHDNPTGNERSSDSAHDVSNCGGFRSAVAEMLLADSTDGIVVLDRNLRCIFWNPAMERISGVSREEALGKCAFDIFPFLRETGEDEYLRRVAAGEIVVAGDRPYFARAAGGHGSFQGRYSPLRNEEGEIIGITGIIRDVTRQKRVELELARRKKQFQSFVEHISDVIMILGRDGAIRYVSSSVERILGYEPAEITGRNAFDFVHSEDRLDVYNRFRRESDVAGVRPPIEFRARHKNVDTWRILEAAGNNLLNDPTVEGIIITARDITERKQAEKALENSRDFYLRLLDDFPTFIWRSGLDGKCDYFNKSWLQFTGRTLEQEMGDGWAEGVHPEDLERCLKTYSEAFKARVPFEMEYRLRRHDGQFRWVLDAGQPFTDLEANFAGYVGSAYDITGRKRWEEVVKRYQLLSENARDIVLFVGPKAQILEANRAALATYGYNRDELLSLSIEDLRAPETLSRLAEQLELARREGILFETVHRRKDGSTFPVEVSSRAAEIGGEAVLLSIIRDISGRKHLEEQFLQAQKMEAVGRLAGGIAHDFNNLMTVVTGYCDLMLNQLGDRDAGYRELNEIRKAGERAADLTHQLLAFSRRQVLELEVIDLRTVILDMESLLRRLIGEDIRLIISLDPALGRVKADRGQLGQVIMNVALNARDAMAKGGKLTIETRNADLDRSHAHQHAVQPGPYVMLAISDTGCGMDTETRSRIFEPFFTTKEQGKGTGLGLSTVYGIINQSGGHISVRSEPGSGTTFKIYLPRIERTIETGVGASSLAGDAHKSATVLLVEDEEQLRSLARQILLRHGYTVLEARTGVEAVQHAEQEARPIDLLLTDIVMPEMHGRELAERVKRCHPEAKIVFMSGYTENTEAGHRVPGGEISLLMKPFTPEGLIGKVREALSGRCSG